MTGIFITRAPIPLQTAGAASLPKRFKLLNWGRNETSEGPVLVDDTTARVFPLNQKAIGRERVPLDYEHNTVPGTPEYKRTQEPREIAGNFNLVCVPGEGIFGEAVTYTASGEKNAPNYEDLSLAPYLDKERRVIAAHSAGLTRTGATYGIHFADAAAALSAGETQLAAELTTLSAQTVSGLNAADAAGKQQPQHKNTPMAEKFVSLALLAGLVGLSADADEASVVGKLKTSLTPAAAVDLAPLSARLAALEGKATGAADLAPLTARLTAVEKMFTDQSNAVTLAERGKLITLMANEGKAPINPATGKAYTAEELKGLDLPLLQVLQANTAVTVPLSARGGPVGDGKNTKFKDKDGKVDLAALFDAENAAAGA